MHIDTLKSNLESASLMAVSIAQSRVTNFLSDNIQYRIQPDSVGPRKDLSGWETEARAQRIRDARRVFGIQAVVERLWHNGEVPVGVTVSVYKATKKLTILNLFVDSKFTPLDDAGAGVMEPFQPVLDLPVYMDPQDETKFDVNWRHNTWQLRYRMWKRKKELKQSIKKIGWWKGLE